MADELARLTTALADRYKVEREIGAGGMATVFLAEDLKHHRQVAIKVLKPELAAVMGAERFLREIEIAARLQHPHILPLHDSGDAEGLLYYVMPYVEGESLRQRLEREKQLPVDEALRIAREVAVALSYAHSRGLIHRDIKPENVLLSHGEAVVADFGVSRAVSAAAGEKLTQTGVAVGTPAYMSPEQASGTDDVDGRSDLYSLACVLFELLVGEQPFTGPSAHAILARHALDSAPPIRTVRNTVPDYVEVAVHRALAKVPADRYSTGTEFAEALAGQVAVVEPVQPEVPLTTLPPPRSKKKRWIIAAAVLVVIGGTFGSMQYWAEANWKQLKKEVDSNTVAVLPFRAAEAQTREVDTVVAYWQLFPILGRGIWPRMVRFDTLLSALSSLSREEREDPWALVDMARRLGAGSVLSGSIKDTLGRLELRATLTEVPSGATLVRLGASGSSDSARAVWWQLGIQLLEFFNPAAPVDRFELSAQRWRILHRQNPSAVIAYLSGLRALADSSYSEAVSRFDAAIRLDSSFALAGVGLVTAGCGLGPTTNDAWLAGARAAWSHRENLPERDRALLLSLVGNDPNEPLRASDICP